MRNFNWIKYFIIIDIFIFLGIAYFFLIKNDNKANIVDNNSVEISELAKLDDNSIVKGHFGENSTQFTLELATTVQKRADGLMFVEQMEVDKGMLFVFEEEQSLTFWMKNTFIPLDIIFLDKDLKIVTIQASAKPNQTSELYPSDSKAKYVIEINGGVSESLNISEGQEFIVTEITTNNL